MRINCDDAAGHVWATLTGAVFLDPLPPSEEKRRTSLVVLVLMLAFMLIGLLTCVALVDTARKAVNEGITKASKEPSQSQQAENNRNVAREATPGKAFTFGQQKMLAG